MMAEPIHVLVADDHPLILRGICEMLNAEEGIAIVGEASRGDETQRLCREQIPDVLLLDLQMPGATALETMTYIHTHCPQTRIIVLTAHDDDVYVHHALDAGVVGYVLKDEVAEVIVTAIRSVMQGGIWLSRRVMGCLTTRETVTLNEREQVVLRRLAEGLTQEQIARMEHLSVRTVKRIVASLEMKLDASCQFVLAMRATQLKLLPESSSDVGTGHALVARPSR